MGIETKYYTNANEPKSLGLASAAVGQIPKIKAVDSNGVPTEWEAADMASGADGKSAYAYAVESGYAGTETEFAAKLAEEIPTVDDTLTQSGQAADASVVGNRLSALSEEIASIDGLASKSYVDTKVAGLVNSAPETLDTLNELAAALGNDANFSTTIATQLGNKVDKVDGKGLSTNDYTTDEKTKLLGINAGAQVNVLESVKVNGAVLTVTDKTVDISVPTKTSNLTNDSGYITSIPSEYITESELNAKGYLTNYTETDPTVPTWAKAATKPTYTAAEVGALPADTVIPVVPDSLKNPYAITFTGGATGSYDGSSELSIAIPEAKTYKAGNGISISDDGTISVTTATYYTGTADPVNTLGADGDLYLKTEG